MATIRAYNDEVLNITREKEYSRNIRRAQLAQKREQYKNVYIQKIAQDINESRENIQNKPNTQAQQKHVFKKQQKNIYNKKSLRQINKRKKFLAKKYQKVIKKYNNTPWILMYAAAAMSLFGGFFTEFLIGYIFVIPANIFIAINMRRAFNKMERREINVITGLMLVVKMIPIISMLPASIVAVYIAKKKAREKMIRSKNKLKKLNKRNM